jgi:antitoxin ParD1/3/4
MGTMNVSLSDALRNFVEEQVARGGYGTSSEYVAMSTSSVTSTH